VKKGVSFRNPEETSKKPRSEERHDVWCPQNRIEPGWNNNLTGNLGANEFQPGLLTNVYIEKGLNLLVADVRITFLR
jgi:hypothetical protein